jgi:hypothetical protein
LSLSHPSESTALCPVACILRQGFSTCIGAAGVDNGISGVLPSKASTSVPTPVQRAAPAEAGDAGMPMFFLKLLEAGEVSRAAGKHDSLLPRPPPNQFIRLQKPSQQRQHNGPLQLRPEMQGCPCFRCSCWKQERKMHTVSLPHCLSCLCMTPCPSDWERVRKHLLVHPVTLI